MAQAILNPLFTSINGRVCGIVFYSFRGNTYFRRYVKPCNPDTIAQKANRGLFRDAMLAWQGLSEFDKASFRRRAGRRGMTGHNLFISRYIASRRDNIINENYQDTAGPDTRACARPCSSLDILSHSVSGSMPGAFTENDGHASVLLPDGG